jgi:hypothetical protein
MKLFLLESTTDLDYEMYDGVVIAAPSRVAAREIWQDFLIHRSQDARDFKITEIGTALVDTAKIILTSNTGA